MTNADAFWDKVAPGYAKRRISDVPAYEKTLERTRAHLQSDHKVLEIGSGTGTTALKLAPYVAHVTATDISGEMVRIGKEKAEDQGVENVQFEKANVAHSVRIMPPYDIVLSYNLLHLVEDLPTAVGDIRSALKPGGLFISKTPCLGTRAYFLRTMIAVLQFFGKAPYVSFFSTDQYDDALKDAGFEILETGSYPKKTNHFVVARLAADAAS